LVQSGIPAISGSAGAPETSAATPEVANLAAAAEHAVPAVHDDDNSSESSVDLLLPLDDPSAQTADLKDSDSSQLREFGLTVQTRVARFFSV
jgi:hypothetical protein